MAHEKVYGICEDKCRVEVYPKEKFFHYVIPMDTALTLNGVKVTIPNFNENSVVICVKEVDDFGIIHFLPCDIKQVDFYPNENKVYIHINGDYSTLPCDVHIYFANI